MITSTAQAERVDVTFFTFGGNNTWEKGEWVSIFQEVKRRYLDELSIRLRLENHFYKRENRCRKYFKYESEKTYGNCIIRRQLIPRLKKTGHNGPVLVLTPGIPINNGTQEATGGLATGICKPLGAAMVHGKKQSDHYFKNGINVGLSMSITTMQHELGHLLGAQHDDESGAKKLSVMDSDVLFLIVHEFIQVQPYPKFNAVSRRAIKKCLKSFF